MKFRICLYFVLALVTLTSTACGSPVEVTVESSQTPPAPTATSIPPTATETPAPKLDPLVDPVHGILELSNGFRPNPVIQPLLSGGEVDMGTTPGDSTCSGFAESAPDLAIDWTDGGFLRIFFIPDKSANTSLAIQDPQGNWHCQDDSFETHNPALDFKETLAGRYNIWVGGEAANQKDLGKLYITQIEEIDPTDLNFSQSVQNEKIQRAAPALTTEISLEEGFSPDPMVIELVAGGPVDLNLALEFPLQGAKLGDHGFTHVEPDVRLHWSGSGYLKFFFVADNGVDTFLFIGDPNDMDNLNDTREIYGVVYEDPLLEFMSTFNDSTAVTQAKQKR